MARKWEETPLAKFLSVADEFTMLKATSSCCSYAMSIAGHGLMSYDAFRMFDYSRTGLLAPANVFGASEWLELPVSALDVIDMIRIADSDRDG